jgi:hypothetical protein
VPPVPMVAALPVPSLVICSSLRPCLSSFAMMSPCQIAWRSS